MKKRHQGYSIIDLLFVVALAAIVVALVAPPIRTSVRSYRLAAGADMLAAELNAARVLAISRGTMYRINFNMTRNSVQIVDMADSANPTRVEKKLGSNLQLVSVPSTPIVFTSRGTARGGQITLTNGSGEQVTVEITDSGETVVHNMQASYEFY